MGQRMSLLKSTPKASQPENKKYPLPIENLMLQQIKREYQSSSHIIVAEGDSMNNDDLSLFEDALPNEITLPEPQSFQKLLLEHICHKYDDPASSFCEELYDSDESTKEQSFNFIDLPFLVVQTLLDYVSPMGILALRATCRTTKSWIDNNNYVLKNVEMRIQPEHCKYNHEPPHTSPWSSFAIPFVHIDSSLVQDTIHKYADMIWSLEVYPPQSPCSVYNYPCNHPRRLFELIGRCHQLERLKICRLDTLTQLPEGKECFQCLRVLSIDRIQWMNHSDFLLFENLIMACPLLEYLKAPEYEILGSLAFVFFDQNVSPEREHLIRPLIRYLDCYRRPVGEGALAADKFASKLYIDVVEYEDFKLCSSEIFYELSRKCVECNAVLMNVYFVPRDAVLRNEQNIVESFASMFGFIKIDFRAELWKNLEVMECWIEDFPDDLDLTIRQFEFLKTVSKIQTLRSLTIRMSVDDPDICSGALQACVGQNFSGIRKLILRRHQAVPDTFVRLPPGFGSCFSNLKFVYFQELDVPDEDFAGLWPSIPNLEELFVYKCPYLTQDAFIGTNEQLEAPVLKLTKLQILVIFLYDGAGGFDDNFLVKGLRHMKVKGFALRGTAGVEFTESGMFSLLNSPFHDTIEDFEAPSSCFKPALSANYWRFYVALPKRELRRNRIWLSCSVLLSSLSSRRHPYDFKRKCLGI